jgi:HprK-related kinase A
LIVADLSRPDLDRRLQGTGLRLRIGPLVANIRSELPSVGNGLATHYARHVVGTDDDFADIHVELQRGRAPGAWRRCEVVFGLDGAQPLARLPGDDGFPLLEWALQWSVSAHCHHFLIVHGAALERHGRALLLPGPDGAGKSTLAAGLALSGWRLLSDAIVLLDLETGRILPLPRPIGVDGGALEALRAFQPSFSFAASEHALPRGNITYLSAPASSFDSDRSVLPAWVVFARYEPGGAAQMRPLDGALAFMSLVENAVNYNLHGRRGFETLAKVIDACDSHQCTHGTLPEAVTMFSSLAVGARVAQA